MLHTIRIHGKHCRELADEIAKIVGGTCHYNLHGHILAFAIRDAAQLRETAEHAGRYWASLGKRAKAHAAETLQAKISEVMITETYRSTFC